MVGLDVRLKIEIFSNLFFLCSIFGFLCCCCYVNAAPAVGDSGNGANNNALASVLAGDKNLINVNSTLYKIVSYPRQNSYDSVAAEYLRRLGSNNGNGSMAVVRTLAQHMAIIRVLLRNQFNNAMIGLRLGRTMWHWVNDGSPVRGQGNFAIPGASLRGDVLQLSCAKDCISYCQFNKMPYAAFQEETLKCFCKDDVDFDSTCGVLGCSKADQFDFYDTDDGSYDHWATGRPQLSHGCAALSRADGNLWADRQCSEHLPFLCQFDRWVVNSMPLDYKACFGDRCYALFKDTPRTFDDAHQYCADKNGRLAQIDSFQHQLNIEVALDNFTNNSMPQTRRLTKRQAATAAPSSNFPLLIWIGATNFDYGWPDGSALSDADYTNWAPNQPNRNYDCVVMENWNDDYKWKTARCDSNNVFVLSFKNVKDASRIADFTLPDPATTATPTLLLGGVTGRQEANNQTNGLHPYPAPTDSHISSECPICGTMCGVLIFLAVLCGIQLVIIILAMIFCCGCCRFCGCGKRLYRRNREVSVIKPIIKSDDVINQPSSSNNAAVTSHHIDHHEEMIGCCNAGIPTDHDGHYSCCQAGGEEDDEEGLASCCWLAFCSPIRRTIGRHQEQPVIIPPAEKLNVNEIIEPIVRSHEEVEKKTESKIEEAKNEVIEKLVSLHTPISERKPTSIKNTLEVSLKGYDGGESKGHLVITPSPRRDRDRTPTRLEAEGLVATMTDRGRVRKKKKRGHLNRKKHAADESEESSSASHRSSDGSSGSSSGSGESGGRGMEIKVSVLPPPMPPPREVELPRHHSPPPPPPPPPPIITEDPHRHEYLDTMREFLHSNEKTMERLIQLHETTLHHRLHHHHQDEPESARPNVIIETPTSRVDIDSNIKPHQDDDCDPSPPNQPVVLNFCSRRMKLRHRKTQARSSRTTIGRLQNNKGGSPVIVVKQIFRRPHHRMVRRRRIHHEPDPWEIVPRPSTPTLVSRNSSHNHFHHAHNNQFFNGRWNHVDAAYCHNLFPRRPCERLNNSPGLREVRRRRYVASLHNHYNNHGQLSSSHLYDVIAAPRMAWLEPRPVTVVKKRKKAKKTRPETAPPPASSEHLAP